MDLYTVSLATGAVALGLMGIGGLSHGAHAGYVGVHARAMLIRWLSFTRMELVASRDRSSRRGQQNLGTTGLMSKALARGFFESSTPRVSPPVLRMG